jgi:hypothetical protein
MDLYRRVGHEGALALLLAVYKSYAPALVTLVLPRATSAALRVRSHTCGKGGGQPEGVALTGGAAGQAAGERGWQHVMQRIEGRADMMGAAVSEGMALRAGVSTVCARG